MSQTGDGDARLGDLTALLVDPLVWEDPPADLEQRVLHAIHPDPPPHLAVVGAPRRSRRRFTALAGLAAAAVIAVTFGVVVAGGESDARRVEVAATELAPNVDGYVWVDEQGGGVEFVLDVEGLPPAPEGQFYEGWVKGEAGIVAVGTFHLRGGDDEVRLWSGVDLADYPTFSVTLQDEGGGPDTSGRKVLTADIG